MDRLDMVGRAAEITELSHSLAEIVARHKQPEPTFEYGIPDVMRENAPDSDVNAITNRTKLLGLLDEFRDLLTEPAVNLSQENRSACLSTYPICRLGFADHVPKEGISVQDLAAKVNLDENIVRRIMCHAATYHIFFQSELDYFVHTASSRLLVESEGMRNWLMMGIGETLPATHRIPEVLQNMDTLKSQSIVWSVNNSTKLPVFTALNDLPERGIVFFKAMEWHSQLPGFSPKHLIEHFPFQEKKDTTIVDVGGGFGHVSQALAFHDPNVKCVVQDLSDSVAGGEKRLPEELKDRVTFQSHDFFQEQPVKGADVYLLRHVLHDWSNKYARNILRAFIPALRPGAKIVINDRIIPGFREANYLQERESRDYDLFMFTLTNAQERTLLDWTNLLRDTDPRMKLTRVTRPEKSFLAIMEVTWEEELN
ncbi:S-adenosyl-L-methionine-dependent methyltransferase [Penicillium malachiteum]|uniref:S-adenosyl-L-methionine-dependent methyltransferase n=1 Tax=Penicillium malachiteum TaxID=1324776 RepID=UPI002547F57F|nr:S-adenosyl-L-methionine-dependent methyltransferase [Penicillium malachiteum]KAJ5730262.1 S-adenosyl-L-methionine-dependent methyltransferase [Penicillium malachiteum]